VFSNSISKLIFETPVLAGVSAFSKPMSIIQTRTLSAEQLTAIFGLWNTEYPAQLAYSHICELEAYLAALSEPMHYFALAANGSIAGWAFAFNREGERWFAIIVDTQAQGSGIGSSLLATLKHNEPILNGWVIEHNQYLRADGEPYRSPILFYRNNGFSVIKNRQLKTEKLSAIAIEWKL